MSKGNRNGIMKQDLDICTQYKTQFGKMKRTNCSEQIKNMNSALWENIQWVFEIIARWLKHLFIDTATHPSIIYPCFILFRVTAVCRSLSRLSPGSRLLTP